MHPPCRKVDYHSFTEDYRNAIVDYHSFTEDNHNAIVDYHSFTEDNHHAIVDYYILTEDNHNAIVDYNAWRVKYLCPADTPPFWAYCNLQPGVWVVGAPQAVYLWWAGGVTGAEPGSNPAGLTLRSLLRKLQPGVFKGARLTAFAVNQKPLGEGAAE
jgi:hypothetical protein